MSADARHRLQDVTNHHRPPPFVFLLAVDDHHVVESELLVLHHLTACHDLHDRDERGRRELFAVARRLGRLGVAVQRVSLADGVGELDHAVAFDRERDPPDTPCP